MANNPENSGTQSAPKGGSFVMGVLTTLGVVALAAYGWVALKGGDLKQATIRNTIASEAPARAPINDDAYAILDERLSQQERMINEKDKENDAHSDALAVLTERVDMLRIELNDHIEKMHPEGAIAGATTPVATTPEDSEALSQLNASVAELGEKLDALQQAYNKQSSDHVARLKLLHALEALTAQLQAGRAYAQEMETAKALADSLNMPLGEEAVSTLETHAETGVASHAKLVKDYAEMASIAVPVALSGKENPSLGDRVRSRLGHIISIRKVDSEQSGDSDEALLARGEKALREGDVAAALDYISQLSEAANVLFAAWTKQATAHVNAQTAAAQLKTALLSPEREAAVSSDAAEENN